MIRLGIVGCGAVAEICHLPAGQLGREFRISALADTNISRATTLGEQYSVDYCTDDYHQIMKKIDGAIIALPHYLHAQVALEFLNQGVPVLVEKPLALTLAEAEKLVETAGSAATLLQAGYMYRFCRGARLVRQAIDEGWLGALRSFSLESGYLYNWPAASGFNFSTQQAGGGVLIDTGSHMLDLLLWWLGDVEDVEYRDDFEGGIESDCRLSLTHTSVAGTVQGEVTLSRLRQLSDTARIVGDRFTIEYDLSSADKVRIWPTCRAGEDLSFVAEYGAGVKQKLNHVYAEQLDAFAHAIASGTRPLVSGESVLPAVALIERCYKIRKPLELPWTPRVSPPPRALEI